MQTPMQPCQLLRCNKPSNFKSLFLFLSTFFQRIYVLTRQVNLRMENLTIEKAVSSCQFPITDRSPSFKVYLPEIHSSTLLIPSPFVKAFERKIPEKVQLKNMRGDVWTVNLKVDDHGRVYITQGWEKYAADHLLLRGDMLVFHLLDNSIFYVKVYGTNGCIKEEWNNDSSSEGLATVTIPMGVVKGGPQLVEKTLQPPGSSLGGDAAASANIRFKKIYRKNYRNILGVPKSVLDACDYKLNEDIILRSQRDRECFTITQLLKTSDRIVLGYKGLTIFWKATGVSDGDELQFDIILGKGRKIKEFRMEIIAKAMEIGNDPGPGESQLSPTRLY